MKTSIRHVLVFFLLLPGFSTQASQVKDLKYGTILFDYYQQNYFSALVGYEYAKSKDEFVYNADQARLLKGGMSLSYGLPDDAQAVFADLLEHNVAEDTRNKAWFYLAKMYYYKGDALQASKSLARVQGDVPKEIHQEFNYLATLINIQNKHLESAQQAIDVAVKDSVYESYLIFNLAVTQLANGQVQQSQTNLQKVVQYSEDHPAQEFAVLADRAKQALAHISIEQNDLGRAWLHLQNVRTTGLYSNRALLSYGWTAIKLKHFNKAITALKALNKRSISIAEVQEAKVLLAHLYEQEGATRKALKQYLLAQKSFDGGLTAIKSARRVIAGQRIPEEFVINLEAMMDETDWYGSEPSLDYSKLTPFLIELMSSNPFHSVIKELRDLYALRKNLDYWQQQASEHLLIIEHRQQGQSSVGLAEFIKDSEAKQTRLEDDISDLRLHTMTLDIKEQKRFSTLLQATKNDFDYLDDKIKKIKAIKEPYRQSEKQVAWAKALHKRIGTKIQTTNYLIKKLEDVMRVVVNAELDNHQERMTYYLAQARLGKARLYDQTLYKLEDDAMKSSGVQ